MRGPRRARRSPTIRTLGAAAIVSFAIIALVTAAALVRTSAMLESATFTVVQSAQSQALASEAELALLMYQRISNLHFVTREAELAQTKSELVADMEAVLAAAEQQASSTEEERLLREIWENLTVYLDERAQLEADEIEVEDLLRLTQPFLEATMASLAALREMNDAQAAETHANAIRWNEFAQIFAVGTVAILVAGFLTIAFGLHRYVLRPILDLHDAIARFRQGAINARADSAGLREVGELSEAFNEMADALAEQRERQLAFLAGVAHDLRNPLHAMKLGLLGLVVEADEGQRRAAHAALDRQLDRLARMVEDLLDAARIEAGRLEIRREPFDVRSIVDDLIRLYGPTSPEHRIEAELPGHPVVIDADALRIQQVVGNLISNAIKFSPSGGEIRITVRAGDDHVALSVADQGIGIPPEDQAEIFMPFRRHRSDIAPGAGLGLFVVRRIVEAHGGSIGIDSAPGCGSVFRITLPRAVPSAAD